MTQNGSIPRSIHPLFKILFGFGKRKMARGGTTENDKAGGKKIQFYTISSSDGYWHGGNYSAPNDSFGADPYNWGTEKQANEEVKEAKQFAKKMKWSVNFYVTKWGNPMTKKELINFGSYDFTELAKIFDK